MKRTTLSRGTKPLARGSTLKRTTRIQPLGKRGREDREAIDNVRAEVLERALYRCQRCGEGERVVGRLQLHHRLPRSRGGKHEASNLAALCRVCHRAVHAGAADAHRWIETRKGAA